MVDAHKVIDFVGFDKQLKCIHMHERDLFYCGSFSIAPVVLRACMCSLLVWCVVAECRATAAALAPLLDGDKLSSSKISCAGSADQFLVSAHLCSLQLGQFCPAAGEAPVVDYLSFRWLTVSQRQAANVHHGQVPKKLQISGTILGLLSCACCWRGMGSGSVFGLITRQQQIVIGTDYRDSVVAARLTEWLHRLVILYLSWCSGIGRVK